MLTIDRVFICLLISSHIYCILGSFNVALNKPTWQSSTYAGDVSSRAVDGNNNQYYSGGSCAITQNHINYNWWCVDLKQSFDISSVKIFNRADDENCPDGFYGTNCNIRCPANCTNNICGKMIGSCSNGCQGDLYGSRCEFACSTRCKNGKCNARTGTCTGCKDGSYGDVCEFACSTNCQDDKCDRKTGKCTGCKDGYYGDLCEESCPTCNGSCRQLDGVCLTGCKDGYWGCNGLCLQTCSYCNTGGCRIEDGVCHNGCQVGVNNTKCFNSPT
ncbi:scavenger receptor class F member 1 isoform X2 [Patella vulgata]|uniref:scavenger receptor class F member 1 isoform X2 n=1 Tax=Patella vulgata TaxID=6465 RepID=UPI0024A967DA|nr:scavenger receptor class F member 1 isoform X2 [Patella vulgata]